MAGVMSSCVVAHSYQVTNNPVGTKVGKAKGKDTTIQAACKNGNITKVGTVETKMKMILIFPKFETIVTGE